MKKILVGLACIVVGIFIGYILFSPTSKFLTRSDFASSGAQLSCNIQQLQVLQKSLKEIPSNSKLATDWDFINRIFVQNSCNGLDVGLEKICTFYVKKDLKGLDESKATLDQFLYGVFKSVMEGGDYCGKNDDCLNQYNSITSILEKKYLNINNIEDLKSSYPMAIYDLYKKDAGKFQNLNNEISKTLESCQKK